MKRNLHYLILFITTMSLAQVPTNYVAKYDFTNSSLTNDANAGNGDIVIPSSTIPVFDLDRGNYQNSALDCNDVKHEGFEMANSGGAIVNNIAISFWVNMQNEQSSATQEERILDYVSTNGNGISFGIDATGNFYVSTQVSVNLARRRVFSNPALSSLPWNHIFMQFRKNGSVFIADIFINGIRNTVLSNDVTISNATTVDLFRTLPSENAQLILNETANFSGLVDDIKLYHATLGTANVQSLASEPPVFQCTQIVSIPDANLKARLLAHGNGIPGTTPIDTNGDGEICVSEAQDYDKSLTLENQNISNLTGIEEFTSIIAINCSRNPIASIDFSPNTNLTNITCNNMSTLSYLNVANGRNGVDFMVPPNVVQSYLDTTASPNLSCIQHDTGFDPNTDPNWFKDATASWSISCPSVSCTSIVNIPDANFKSALLDHGIGITGSSISVIDTDGDGEICTTEALTYTGRINVDSENISDLSGIEAFTNITQLNCGFNQLTSIDLTANNALTALNIENNQLTTIDVSSLTALTFLNLANNSLTSIDVVSNTLLTDLFLRFNQLNMVNLSTNTSLNFLYLNNNQLTSLDLTTNNQLQGVWIHDNVITSINLANGNNGMISNMDASNNANQACIQHDSGFNPVTVSGWQKDASANWSTNCNLSNDDVSFENGIQLYPNTTRALITLRSGDNRISSIEVFSITGEKLFQTDQLQFNVSNLKSGMYFVRVISNDGEFAVKKFVKL